MGSVLSYSLYSSILLALLYLTYKWMMAGENQHRYNRAALWIIYAVALFALPVGNRLSGLTASVPVPMPLAEIDMADLMAGMDEVVIAEVPHQPIWLTILLWVYLGGVVFTIGQTLWVGMRLRRIITRGEEVGRYGNKVVIVTDDEGIAPFSWCRYVVMNRADWNENGDMILVHELQHLGLRHWIDLLVAQFVGIFQWYNPAAWLMREELKTVHEYQADSAVLASGVCARDYQMLLIKKAVGARFPSLANSLNHSKLQKRITMMYQSKSRTAGKLGSLVLVPALAIGIAVVSIPAVASVISGASETTLLDSDSKVSKISANTESLAEMRAIAPASDNKAFTAVEKLAEFPGGIEAMMKWLQYNVKYPKEAEKAGEQGKAVVKFTVNKDGSISNATIIKSVSPSIDKEALRVVTSMPKWKPAENGGKKVACWYALPVSFRLAPDKETTKK